MVQTLAAKLEVFVADTFSEALSDVLVGTLVSNLADRLNQVKSKTSGNKLGNLEVYILVVKVDDTIAEMKA